MTVYTSLDQVTKHGQQEVTVYKWGDCYSVCHYHLMMILDDPESK